MLQQVLKTTVDKSGSGMEAVGRYRWTICGLIFFATTINYIDRNVISFLKSTFTDQLGWKIKIQAASWPVMVVYVISTFGSIWGGWLPLNFIRKGIPVFRARKTSMLIYAFLVFPIFFALVLGKAYYIMFALCASAYLFAWLIMHILVPKMKRIEDLS